MKIKNLNKTGDVVYNGQFKYDKRDGNGNLFDEELNNVIIENKSFGFCTYNYSGSWKNDKKHGKGTETWYRPPDLFLHLTESNQHDLLPVYTRQGMFENDKYVGPISLSAQFPHRVRVQVQFPHLIYVQGGLLLMYEYIFVLFIIN